MNVDTGAAGCQNLCRMTDDAMRTKSRYDRRRAVVRVRVKPAPDYLAKFS